MSKAIGHFRNEWELELKCLAQFFLGLLLRRRQSVIGHPPPPIACVQTITKL